MLSSWDWVSSTGIRCSLDVTGCILQGLGVVYMGLGVVYRNWV